MRRGASTPALSTVAEEERSVVAPPKGGAPARAGRGVANGPEAQPAGQHSPPRSTGKARPPRIPGKRADSQNSQELPWAARESQVATWLSNIKPRRRE
mmetsp:Transcript_3194/g.6475  ORF Transcript_3194/g.6475 Transcript_3194/m.6475 type:complete len:98 (-) Transcript_3194:53-346(-)